METTFCCAEFTNITSSEIWTIVIRIITFVIAAFSAYYTYRISRSKLLRDDIDETGQPSAIEDIIRHIYRNKVVIATMIVKYDLTTKLHPGLLCYPSEEHYNKLKHLEDDFYIKNYSRDIEFNGRLHQLKANMRNLDIEINAAIIHSKQENLKAYVRRDLINIDYKLSKIHKLIIELTNGNKDINKIIVSSNESNIKNNNIESYYGCGCQDKVETVIKELELQKTSPENYLKTFMSKYENEESEYRKLSEIFTKDIVIECGKNQNGSDKILIIIEEANKFRGR